MDPIRLLLHQTTAGVDQVGEADRPGWVFAHCWNVVVWLEHLNGDTAEIDRLFTDIRSLPDGFPGRGKLAACALTAAWRRQSLKGKERIEGIVALADLADADPDPLPDWPLTSAAVRSIGLSLALQFGLPGMDVRAMEEEVRRHVASTKGNEPYASVCALTLAAIRQSRGLTENNPSGMPDPFLDIPDIWAGSPTAGSNQQRLAVFRLLMEVQRAILLGDSRRAGERLGELVLLHNNPATSFEIRQTLRNALTSVIPSFRLLGWEPATHLDLDFDLPAEVADVPVEKTALDAWSKAVQLMGEGAVAEAVALLDRTIPTVAETDPWLVHYLTTLGAALADPDWRRNRPGELQRAITVLERARALAGSITHGQWPLICIPLAHAYRAIGRVDQGREIALSGLRAHAWSALSQADPGSAQAASRSAASEALDFALTAAAERDFDTAVMALEFGRGMVLFSALETRDLARRLTEAGRPDLADQWRRSDGSPDPYLRRQAMGVLTGVPVSPGDDPASGRGEGPTRLLDPPGTDEIRAALSALDAGALVYLLPDDDARGCALVVPVDGPAERLLLPWLTNAAVAQFESPLGGEDRSGREIDPPGGCPDNLDDACEWAWDAAMAPLLHRFAKADSTPARLVLIPIGGLATIPWQAAWDRATGSRAVDHAVLSYAVSARLMCDNAWRSRTPVGEDALIVADPATPDGHDLPAARVEAEAVARLYPGAHLIGRVPGGATAPAGRGGKAEVQRWLSAPGSGAVLHLACHGTVRSGPDATSALLLSDGAHLTADELTADLTTPNARQIALVVLAACHTGTSSRGYDEAYSVASAFHSAGVRTTISTQWSVDDRTTAVLMFMLHHYLRTEFLPPPQALHATQLWALHDRQPPDTMPTPLRAYLNETSLDSVRAWAAFVHSGH
ncbi:CHAT domain-containing protein [Actinokineospora sp. 24-640]